MRKIELSLFSLFLLMAVLALLDVTIPFSNIIYPLVTFVLILDYLFFSVAIFNDISFKNTFSLSNYKKSTKIKRTLSILTSIVLTFVLFSVLIGLLNYVGSTIIVFFGLLLCSLWIVVNGIYYLSTKDLFYAHIIARLGLILLLLIVLINGLW